MEWGITMHSTGPHQGLPDYEPQLVSARDGARVTLVATVEVRDCKSGHGHLCRGVVSGQRFRLLADVPAGVHKVTILGGQVSHLRCPILKVDELARILYHREKDLSHIFQLIETCSGMGALGQGASHAGWKTMVLNDVMQSFTDHLQKFGTTQVVNGDICKLSTVAAIHDQAPHASSMAFGFSCQPFSRLGDRREGQDARSMSLPFGLYASFLLQLDLVVTECVPEASQSPFVLKCMQQYMQVTNSDRSEALLELNDVWPSRRRRWWSVILKSFMGRVQIPPFPKLATPPTVASLLPGLMSMTPQEIQELTLSTEERMMFEKYGKGLGGHMLNMMEPLATALHSWANQCVSCACGCRGPLSCNRLQTQGLYGVLVHVPGTTPDRNVRHLSGREMALLTGFPKVEGWTDHQRLLTAGVGQLASPLQAAWVFTSILNHLIDHGFFHGDIVPPQQVLACVAAEVFKLRDEWFQNQNTVTTELFQETIEKFLEPPLPSVSMPQVPDLTPSQDDDIAKSIDAIEKQAGGVANASAQANTQDRQPLASCMPKEDTTEVMPTRYQPPADAHDGCSQKETTNSQRTGRQNLEEQKSGQTQKQPASGPLEPDKTGQNQPASGPPEPDKTIKQPAEGTQEPKIGGAIEFPGFLSAPLANGQPSRVLSNVQPDDVRVPVNQPSRSSGHVAAPSKSAEGMQATHPVGLKSLWDQATGAIQAFATAAVSPSPVIKQSSIPKVQMPAEVCLPVSEVLTPGLMVYDVDQHQICKQHHAKDATVGNWIQGLADLGIQYHTMVDLMGQDIHPDTPLATLRWVVVSNSTLPAQDMKLHDKALFLNKLPRHESLLLQGGAVALDELMYYMSAIDSVGVAKSWEPLVVHTLTDLHTEAGAWLGDMASYVSQHTSGMQSVATEWWAEIPIEAVATMIWINQHWIPVWLVPGTHTYSVTTTADGADLWRMLFPTWEGSIHVQPAFPSVFTHDCGFQAFAWLVSQCTYTPGTSLSAEEAQGWRQLYWQQVLIHSPKSKSMLLGGHSELETALQALLRDHGVFPERVQERATHVLQALTPSAVAGVFKAARPWQQLKQLASAHTPVLRLVMEEELQATIRARTRQKGSIKSKGASKGRAPPPVHLHPQDINIPQGIFRLESGELLSQLSVKQIGQHAKGVIAFTEEEVQPYLKQTGPVGQGLGFLVVSPYSEEITALGEVHRFPVQSKITGEPVLISAVLLQRSQARVTRNVPQQAPAIDQIATQTIKVLVYRDQCSDWESVIRQPVKYLISQIEELQTCHGNSCLCSKWHPCEKSDTPILDVWQRDFLSSHFQKTKASEAQLYAVAMRVPESVFHALYKRSGQDGIYFEPRTEDGKGQDPAFHTIWIPRKPFSEVVAQQSMQETAVSLIRVGARYGFKVAEADAAQVHEQVSPGDPYIAGPHRMVYHVGPFPWGTTKKAIQQLFHQWGWVAKAIHSAAKAKDSSGLMWLVHAAAPPGHLVYQLQHGDVIIHQMPASMKETWKPPQAQASSKERRSQPHDEVFHNDPWAESAKQLTRRADSSNAQWSTLEATIDQKIAQRLDSRTADKDENMLPTMEPRIQALEQQVAQLHQRSVQLDGKVDFLHQQAEGQSKQFESALDTKLAEQMHRIEMLMTKRARNQEWRCRRWRPAGPMTPIFRLLLMMVSMISATAYELGSDPSLQGSARVKCPDPTRQTQYVELQGHQGGDGTPPVQYHRHSLPHNCTGIGATPVDHNAPQVCRQIELSARVAVQDQATTIEASPAFPFSMQVDLGQSHARNFPSGQAAIGSCGRSSHSSSGTGAAPVAPNASQETTLDILREEHIDVNSWGRESAESNTDLLNPRPMFSTGHVQEASAVLQRATRKSCQALHSSNLPMHPLNSDVSWPSRAVHSKQSHSHECRPAQVSTGIGATPVYHNAPDDAEDSRRAGNDPAKVSTRSACMPHSSLPTAVPTILYEAAGAFCPDLNGRPQSVALDKSRHKEIKCSRQASSCTGIGATPVYHNAPDRDPPPSREDTDHGKPYRYVSLPNQSQSDAPTILQEAAGALCPDLTRRYTAASNDPRWHMDNKCSRVIHSCTGIGATPVYHNAPDKASVPPSEAKHRAAPCSSGDNKPNRSLSTVHTTMREAAGALCPDLYRRHDLALHTQPTHEVNKCTLTMSCTGIGATPVYHNAPDNPSPTLSDDDPGESCSRTASFTQRSHLTPTILHEAAGARCPDLYSRHNSVSYNQSMLQLQVRPDHHTNFGPDPTVLHEATEAFCPAPYSRQVSPFHWSAVVASKVADDTQGSDQMIQSSESTKRPDYSVQPARLGFTKSVVAAGQELPAKGQLSSVTEGVVARGWFPSPSRKQTELTPGVNAKSWYKPVFLPTAGMDHLRVQPMASPRKHPDELVNRCLLQVPSYVGSLSTWSQETINSQRTGRQDLEEQKSGVTQKQPASGTQEPDKKGFKQPASGPPEPDKNDKQPAEGTQEPKVDAVGAAISGLSASAISCLCLVPSPVQPNDVRVPACQSARSSSHTEGATTSMQRCLASSFTVQKHAPLPQTLGRSQEQVDDTMSLMASGPQRRPGYNQNILSDRNIAAQSDEEFVDHTDEESSTSSEDPRWRDFFIYTVHQPPAQRSLNMVSMPLQRYQCATVLQWTVDQLVARYEVDPTPDDLQQSNMGGMLARYHEDPPQGGLCMVLIDVLFHPPAPRWDTEVIRSAMFIPAEITNHQFLASMHLLPYCRYAHRPCFLQAHVESGTISTNPFSWKFRTGHICGWSCHLLMRSTRPRPHAA